MMDGLRYYVLGSIYDGATCSIQWRNEKRVDTLILFATNVLAFLTDCDKMGWKDGIIICTY